MVAYDVADITSQFEALSKNAYLDILLPKSSDFDLATVFRDGVPERISSVPSRRNLYSDENSILTIVLRTLRSEDEVNTLLPSLEVSLAAHATDAVPQGSGNAASASGKHDLTSITIPGSDSVRILSTGDATYVVWKPTLHLLRPRAKLQRPAIYFTAHVTISVQALNASMQREKDYLRSFEPQPANVLEPLRFDPSLNLFDIYLSETRITKVAPTAARMHDDVKPIRGASKRALPILPALFTRIRYSALPDAVIASLHLEVTQLVTGNLLIKNVSLELPSAQVETLCHLDPSTERRAGDETVLLYKLQQSDQNVVSNVATVYVTIKAAVSLDEGIEFELDIKWQAQVHLSQTAIQPAYKWSRPLSGTSTHQPTRASLQGAERPSSLDVSQKPAAVDSGITFNFTAPPTVVRNQEFTLDVQCINRSARPRRFALVVLQPKRAHANTQSKNTVVEDTDIIASLCDAPPLERPKPPDVLDLNPDVRIGPLPPGACYETQMKFRATATGVLDLGVIRVVDLDTRQTVDVRELPDVIGLETTSEEIEAL